MDYYLQDDDVKRLPPEYTRILLFDAKPRLNGKQVRLHLEVTPYQQRPNIDLIILNASGKETAQTTIIEAITWQIDITMHLAQAETGGEYTARAVLYYLPDISEPSTEKDDEPLQLPEPMVVDRAELTFSIPSQPAE